MAWLLVERVLPYMAWKNVERLAYLIAAQSKRWRFGASPKSYRYIWDRFMLKGTGKKKSFFNIITYIIYYFKWDVRKTKYEERVGLGRWPPLSLIHMNLHGRHLLFIWTSSAIHITYITLMSPHIFNKILKFLSPM